MIAKNKKIKSYEKRFGIIAIEKGFITRDHLVEALKIQVEEDITTGSHRLMGIIFFDMGVMTDKQVEEVVSNVMDMRRG